MSTTLFRQALAISIAGHLTFFSLFGFSFGPRLPAANFTQTYFQGAILRDTDLFRAPAASGAGAAQFIGRAETLVLDKTGGSGLIFDSGSYLKPQVFLTPDTPKLLPTEKIVSRPLSLERKEPSLTFYPKLPYDLSLYFKDRQVAHIEIMFEVSSQKQGNAILVARKVSSGNLELDLLSMRYLGHYLFLQKSAFSPDQWHSVKIDLSTLND